MLKQASAGGVIFIGLTGAALASPTPVILSATPDTLPAGASSANFEVDGQNFLPYVDGNVASTGGFDPSEVLHVFLRVVSAAGAPGSWTHCAPGNGCTFGYNATALTFTLDGRWLAAANSQIQIHFFTGFGLENITEPNQVDQAAGSAATDWSNTINVAVGVPNQSRIAAPMRQLIQPPTVATSAPVMTRSPAMGMRAPMTAGDRRVTLTCPSAILLNTPGGTPVMNGAGRVTAMRGETFDLIASESQGGRNWSKLQNGPTMGWVVSACVQ